MFELQIPNEKTPISIDGQQICVEDIKINKSVPLYKSKKKLYLLISYKLLSFAYFSRKKKLKGFQIQIIIFFLIFCSP